MNRWTVEQANRWYQAQPWLVGCNFVPSSAINQLEMWQSDTFDPVTIDRELSWAKNIGFNTIRVFMHDLAYAQDPKGFLDRVDRFLKIAASHGIRTMPVFFDDCWLAESKIGRQPEPLPGVHNSGWLESPGLPLLERYPTDAALRQRLETYVKAVITHFRDDPRILMWDLYNEPGGIWYKRGENGNPFQTGRIDALCVPLLRDVHVWARAINPSQPLTCCWYIGPYETEAAMMWSDVITFHSYEAVEIVEKLIQRLQAEAPGRPLICTEYLARQNSKFQTHLPLFRKYHVGAMNWGFVAGKTMTIYPWSSWKTPGSTQEPDVWHHEILRKDGTPYDPAETTFIREITKTKT